MTTSSKHFSLLPRRGSRLWTVGRMVLLAAVVGVAAGLGAIAFDHLCHWISKYALGWAAGYDEADPSGDSLRLWVLILMPALGGLIAGFLIYTFARQAAGAGAGKAIDAYHNRQGKIRGRVGIVKILASAITLGTGGSGGREGPIALVGASFGSFLADRFKLSAQERRVLLVAGMGAGVGAFFRAPLAGAIFAVEVLYADPDFEAGSLIPAFFATTIAYCVFSMACDTEAIIHFAQISKFNKPLLLLPLTVLTTVMVLLSLACVKCLHGTENLFKRLRLPNHVKPAIGALGAGLVAVGIFYALSLMHNRARLQSLSVLGSGFGFLKDLLQGNVHGSMGMGTVVVLLAAVALGKIVTTSLTIGSGGSGGVFGPSMVIGGAIGGAVGIVFQQLMPEVVTRIDIFVLLGAAGMFSASANTPVSTLIMVSEMTGSPTLLLPSMWVCGLAYLLGRGWSLYGMQVLNRAHSPAHHSELIVDVLAGLVVRDAWKKGDEEIIVIPRDMLLSEVAIKVTGTRQTCFPVIDEAGEMCGYLGINDIRYFLFDKVAGELVVARELAATDIEPLGLHTDLTTVMARFARTVYDQLPIADSDNPNVIKGLLSRQDVISIYNDRLDEKKATTT